jgi:hypothetical protein
VNDEELLAAYREFALRYGEWMDVAFGQRGSEEHFGVRDACNKAYLLVREFDFGLPEMPKASRSLLRELRELGQRLRGQA